MTKAQLLKLSALIALKLSSSTKALASPIPIILIHKLSPIHQPPQRRHRSSRTIAEAHASSPTRFIILLTHFESQLISAEAAAAFLSSLLWFSADLRYHSILSLIFIFLFLYFIFL